MEHCWGVPAHSRERGGVAVGGESGGRVVDLSRGKGAGELAEAGTVLRLMVGGFADPGVGGEEQAVTGFCPGVVDMDGVHEGELSGVDDDADFFLTPVAAVRASSPASSLPDGSRCHMPSKASPRRWVSRSSASRVSRTCTARR